MGWKTKLGEICGCAIYRVSYCYKAGYFVMEDPNGKAILRSAAPAGLFAAAVRSVGGRG